MYLSFSKKYYYLQGKNGSGVGLWTFVPNCTLHPKNNAMLILRTLVHLRNLMRLMRDGKEEDAISSKNLMCSNLSSES